ncbi:MBL fold metallo-hydrolase [Allorhizobium undicola]|uniref:MBL fold metallo-hydrolase n=1 Tax=Allorhizobium undicola TaxID=78527 RepID=UPI0004858D69|nr:MBL fold metallo-hydrolase [Allorhizobium undicola]
MGKLQAAIIPVTPFQQNCTIFFDSETLEGVVVDPGGDVEEITRIIREKALKISEIWITHGHLDHAGGAQDLREALEVPVIGPHEDDRVMLENLEMQASRFNVPMRLRNLVPDRFLQEGDVVGFGEHRFEVYHCPGHAPGHVIFFNRAAGFAHLGDVLFNGSIGRTDLPGGNHQQLLSSIRDKVLPLGDEVGFICGHGPGSRIGDERRNNPFLVGL